MKNTGDNIQAENSGWTFDGDVCDTFDDHVSSQVPGYNDGHKIIEYLSDYFINVNSVVYDIGCSTGKLLNKLVKRNKNKIATYYGLDAVENMILKAKKNYDSENLKFIHEDIVTTNLEKSDLIISYYTIQFIHPNFFGVIIFFFLFIFSKHIQHLLISLLG